MGEGPGGHFSKEDIPTASGPVRSCSTSSFAREMQAQTAAATMETTCSFLKKLKIGSPRDPALPLWAQMPAKCKRDPRGAPAPAFTAALSVQVPPVWGPGTLAVPKDSAVGRAGRPAGDAPRRLGGRPGQGPGESAGCSERRPPGQADADAPCGGGLSTGGTPPTCWLQAKWQTSSTLGPRPHHSAGPLDASDAPRVPVPLPKPQVSACEWACAP